MQQKMNIAFLKSPSQMRSFIIHRLDRTSGGSHHFTVHIPSAETSLGAFSARFTMAAERCCPLAYPGTPFSGGAPFSPNPATLP